MKFYTLLLISIFFTIHKVSAEGNIQIIESDISAVTLFFSEAQIFKNAKVQLNKGVNQIQLNAISPFIIKESLKVGADKLVAINSISIETDIETNEDKRLIYEAKNSNNQLLNIIQDSIQFCQSYREILSQQKTFIKQNRLSGKIVEFGLPHTLESFNNNLSAYEKKYIELENKLIANANIKKDLQNRLQDLKYKDRIADSKKKQSKATKLANLSYNKIYITIQSEQAQSIVLSVDYLVKNAAWEPVYDLMFTDYADKPTIIYKAKFYQNTGEDWNGVQLTYSTAQPSSDKVLPEFKPAYLDYFKEAEQHVLIKPKSTRWEKAKGEVNAISSNPEEAIVMTLVEEPAQYQTVKNIQTDLNLTYKLKDTISIATFETAQFQYLKEALFDANYLYRVFPYINYKVYKIAQISDWQKLNLLSGTANIYADKLFIGKIDLITNKLSGDFEFALGVDAAIAVNREKLTVSSNKKWLEMKRKDELGYQINVQNNRPQNIQVEVIEQIPLSKQSDIEVSMIKIDDATYDATSGKLTWLLDIPSKDKTSKAFAYEITYPKDTFIGFD